MFDPYELFRSVESIWLIWIFSCIGLGALTVAGLSRIRWRRAIPRFPRDERGAAYALSYVMVVPLYFIFVCLVVETSHILVTKAGTVYAAFAGARTAVVWESAEPGEVRIRTMIAARQAFVPFATGLKIPGATVPPATSTHNRYLETYKELLDDRPVSDGYLLTKLANTDTALDVDYRAPASWSDDVQVNVVYRFRFHVPVIGHALGTRAEDGYRYFNIATTVRLQNEGPQNATQRTGISYASPE